MVQPQLKQNRMMLLWAYLATFLYYAGTYAIYYFKGTQFIQAFHLSPVFFILRWAVIIFLILQVITVAGLLNRSKVWWSVPCGLVLLLPPLRYLLAIPILLFFLKRADHPFELSSCILC